MLEVELKSVVPDLATARAAVERAGGELVFHGRLEDRRYDTSSRTLGADDHVLRMRVYRDASGTRAELDWKGPTRTENGFKLREEIGAPVGDADAMREILARLGYVVTSAIDREIAQYELAGATVRFERYPRMDDLVEVEGSVEDIERAIAALALPRAGFTADRLSDFAARYEARTGLQAVTADEAMRPTSGAG